MIDKVFKFCENRLPDSELASLYKWVNESERNKILFAEIKNYYSEKDIYQSRRCSYKERERILGEIYEKQGWYRQGIFRPHPARAALQVAVSFVVIAAAILGVIQFNHYKQERVAREYLSANIQSADKKAVLKLSNGAEMLLGVKDNKGKSKKFEVEDDGAKVKINEIKSEKPRRDAGFTNTISTELGGYYTAVLPDGSEVWINSKSRISFSDDFGLKERRVTLTGEAYFSVVKMESVPFIVEMGKRSVEVLGTEFNIKAYQEEAIHKISLLKGSVRYSDSLAGLTQNLSPNWQLIVDNKTGTITEKIFDPYIFTAWQDGYFLFSDETLDEILRTMSRWFNIEIKLENDEYNSKRFNGKISRELGIMPLMSKLQMSYKFRYYMEEGALIIK
jgi:hypothetical protein